MKENEVIKLNRIIGKVLVEIAHETYLERIEVMKTRPFDEVIEAIKNYKETRYNKASGYFASEAIRYFDEKLEKEHNEIWLEIEDTMDDNWFKAIEQFRW